MKLNKIILEKLYIKDKLSLRAIAKKFEISNPNTIRRMLIKYNITPRTKSQAQSNFLKQHPECHPTRGRERTNKEKIAISNAVNDFWDNISDKDRQAWSEQSKKLWDAKTTEEKAEMQKLAHRAIREAATHGSKFERFLRRELEIAKYLVQFHVQNLMIHHKKAECDIFLPGLKTIIEVQGISHYEPIWGPTRLKQQQKSDMTKAGLMLSGGFAVIFIQHTVKNLTQKYQRDMLVKLLKVVKQIDEQFPPQGERFFTINED